MEKLLGLDLGTQTLGMSYYDGLIDIVHPIENFSFEPGNFKKARTHIIEYCAKENITNIVLGYPLNMDGSKSKRTLSTERFKEDLLKEAPNLNIVYCDERLTTVEAYERLDMMGVNKKKQKDLIDMISAVIILESYVSKKKEGKL